MTVALTSKSISVDMKNPHRFIYLAFLVVILMRIISLTPLSAQEEQDSSPMMTSKSHLPSEWDTYLLKYKF